MKSQFSSLYNQFCAQADTHIGLLVASQLVVHKMYKSWQWIRNNCSSHFEAASSKLIDCNWKRILQSKMCRYQNWQRENTYCVDFGLLVASQLVVHKMCKSWQWIRNNYSFRFEATSSRLIDYNWKRILQR